MIKLIFPCEFVGITQNYKSSHKAIDIGWSTKYGGPNHVIYAPYDGKISYVKSNVKKNDKSKKSYGNYIKIKHNSSVYTLVAHLKYGSICVKKGDKVLKGQKLGLMGNTGYSFGVHTHYEVIKDGKKVNPLKYTYYTSKHKVSSTTKKKYAPLFLESEVNKLVSEEKIVKEESEEDSIFEYTCPKTGIYKIKLNENEKLIIKD